MHLLVNAVGIKHSGGAVVLLDFLYEALRHEKISKISILCSPRTVRNFDFPVSEKCIELEQFVAERSYLYRIIWSQLVLPRISMRLQADAFVCMVGIGQGGRSLSRTVFIQQSLPFAQDVLNQVNKQQKLRLKIMHLLMKRASRQSHKIIVQTPTMENWVSSAFRIPEEKFVVVKPTPPPPVNTDGCEPLAQLLEAPTGSRLLYVGSDSVHKNLPLILQGVGQLREKLPEATLFLTLPDDHPANRLSGVVCIDYLSGCGLWQAYELSDVLVMPSLVETAGLPMLEALSVGTPVLAADRPYAHDICGEAAFFFEPLSASDFAHKAQYFLTNETLQADLSHKGKQVIAELRRQEPYKKMVDAVIDLNLMNL